MDIRDFVENTEGELQEGKKEGEGEGEGNVPPNGLILSGLTLTSLSAVLQTRFLLAPSILEIPSLRGSFPSSVFLRLPFGTG